MKAKKNHLAWMILLVLCMSIFAGCADTPAANLSDSAEGNTGTADYPNTEETGDTASDEEPAEEVTEDETADDIVTEVPSDNEEESSEAEDSPNTEETEDTASDAETAEEDTDGGSAEEDTGDKAVDEYTDDEVTDDVVAEVTAVDEETSTLTLTLYTPDSAYADYEITDRAAVELSYYTATVTSEEYTVSQDVTVYLTEDSVLREISVSDISVADMVVIHTDEAAGTEIVVYPSETTA